MWTYNYTPSSDDIMHYGVLGMKWGHRKSNYHSTSAVRRNRLTSAVSKIINEEAEKREEQFRDKLASRTPRQKRHREQVKKLKKQQKEIKEISQAKGKAKTYKILKKIGNDLLSNPVVIDGPTGPKHPPRI